MAHVQIDDIDPRRTYTVGASARSNFPVPFAYFATSDLTVTVDGTALVLETDYTVTGTAAEGGFSSGEIDLDTAVTNAVVVIERVLPIERTTDFPNSGPFSIPALNTQFDKGIAIDQQLNLQLDDIVQSITDAEALFTSLLNVDTTVTLFTTRNAIEAAEVGAAVPNIRTAGYDIAGDRGQALYVRAADGAGPGKVQSADGAWWELADPFPSLAQFGGSPDASSTVNDAAIIEAVAFGLSHVPVPDGEYDTDSNPEDITGAIFTGPGQLLDVSGNKRGRIFNVISEPIPTIQTPATQETWINGTSRSAIQIEQWVTSDVTDDADPTSTVFYNPTEASPIAIFLYAAPDTLHRNEQQPGGDGSSSVSALNLVLKNSSAGGLGAFWADVNIDGEFALFDETKPTIAPVGGLIGGNVHANAPNVFLNVIEVRAGDGGHRVTAIGAQVDLVRTEARGSGEHYWYGYSVAAQDSTTFIDAMYRGMGPAHTGLDLVNVDFESDQVAIALPADARIYMNATATANGIRVLSGDESLAWDSVANAFLFRVNGAEALKIAQTSAQFSGANYVLGINDLSGAANAALQFTSNGTLEWSFGKANDNTMHIANAAGVDVIVATQAKSVVLGSAAIATNATDGFLYLVTCAGTPTGTATDYTGRTPIVIDSSANKLWARIGGTWRSVTLT